MASQSTFYGSVMESIKPGEFDRMDAFSQARWMDMMDKKMQHEAELKRLEVEKAKYEAMNRNTSEVKEEEKHEEA